MKNPEPEDDLTGLSYNDLMAKLSGAKDALDDKAGRRLHAQLERDMLFQIIENSKTQMETLAKAETAKVEEFEQEHAKHLSSIQAYQQKLKQLDYENEKRGEALELEGREDHEREAETHAQRLAAVREESRGLKEDYAKLQAKALRQVLKKQHQLHGMLETTRKDLQAGIARYEARNEAQFNDLRNELELKLKAEIHEIEERKNFHINELIKDHERAYDELKRFYNTITIENLALIKSQKEELELSREKKTANAKKLAELRENNEKFARKKAESEKMINDLKHKVKQYHKDKISLSNLKIKLKSLTESLNKLLLEKAALEKKFDDVVCEIADAKGGYVRGMLEVSQGANEVNEKLESTLDSLNSELQVLEKHLSSTADPSKTSELFASIGQAIKGKNAVLDRLEYLKLHAVKSYNDSLKVHEAKLARLGIEPNVLGFQLIEGPCSQLPANLVAK